jgi:hypothetical protein
MGNSGFLITLIEGDHPVLRPLVIRAAGAPGE